MNPWPATLGALVVYGLFRAYATHRRMLVHAMREGVALGVAHAGGLTMTEGGVRIHNPSPECDCFGCLKIFPARVA